MAILLGSLVSAEVAACSVTPEDKFITVGKVGRVTAFVNMICEEVYLFADGISEEGNDITFTLSRNYIHPESPGDGVFAFQHELIAGAVFEAEINEVAGVDFYIKTIEVLRDSSPPQVHFRVKTTPFREICSGGIDEDGDGNIDCADDECFGDSICNVPVVDAVDDVLRQIGIVLRDAGNVYPGTLPKISAIARILRDYFASLG